VLSTLRFRFDPEENVEPSRHFGVSLKAAQEIFDQAHSVDRKNNNSKQFRTIG